MAALEREAIQKQIQQDWANREYVEIITASIKKIADFLNSFGSYILFILYFKRLSTISIVTYDIGIMTGNHLINTYTMSSNAIFHMNNLCYYLSHSL